MGNETKDSIIFYKSFYEAINEGDLSKKAQLEIYNSIFRHFFYGEEFKLKGQAKTIFTLIKPTIDGANKRYQASVKNGKKGGRPKNNKDSEKTQEKPKKNLKGETQPKPSQNLTDDEHDNVHDAEHVHDNVDVHVHGTQDSASDFFPSEKSSPTCAEQFDEFFKDTGITEEDIKKARNKKGNGND